MGKATFGTSARTARPQVIRALECAHYAWHLFESALVVWLALDTMSERERRADRRRRRMERLIKEEQDLYGAGNNL